jgi:hypothetical protein
MADIKHVGRITTTGRKCLVAYRTLPGDAYSSLIIDTTSLPDEQHNALIQLVESPSSQSAYEFAEVLARAKFPDGSTMLPALHMQGKLLKVPTDQVVMTPNFTASISLAELNQIIAEQRGVSVSDLSVKEPEGKVEVVSVAEVNDPSKDSGRTTSGSVSGEESLETTTSFNSSEDEAKYYRSQADRLSKEAAALRRKAEELVPTKKSK